jgi:membrane protein CcdC involved in cytochrome C biogenesis
MTGALSAIAIAGLVAIVAWCIVSVWRITKYANARTAHPAHRPVAFLDESSQRTGDGES